MKKLVKLAKVLVGCAVLFSVHAEAVLITSSSDPSASVVDFSQYSSLQRQTGNINIGEIVGEDIIASGLGNDFYTTFTGAGLINNGNWGDAMRFIAGPQGVTLQFDFLAGPISMVGAFMNYGRSTANTRFNTLEISAIGQAGQVLESYNVPSIEDIITPSGFNDGAFRGIQRDDADIYGFRVFSNQWKVLDDLTFSRQVSATQIAEPYTLSLFALGLLAIFLGRKRVV